MVQCTMKHITFDTRLYQLAAILAVTTQETYTYCVLRFNQLFTYKIFFLLTQLLLYYPIQPIPHTSFITPIHLFPC